MTEHTAAPDTESRGSNFVLPQWYGAWMDGNRILPQKYQSMRATLAPILVASCGNDPAKWEALATAILNQSQIDAAGPKASMMHDKHGIELSTLEYQKAHQKPEETRLLTDNHLQSVWDNARSNAVTTIVNVVGLLADNSYKPSIYEDLTEENIALITHFLSIEDNRGLLDKILAIPLKVLETRAGQKATKLYRDLEDNSIRMTSEAITIRKAIINALHEGIASHIRTKVRLGELPKLPVDSDVLTEALFPREKTIMEQILSHRG